MHSAALQVDTHTPLQRLIFRENLSIKVAVFGELAAQLFKVLDKKSKDPLLQIIGYQYQGWRLDFEIRRTATGHILHTEWAIRSRADVEIFTIREDPKTKRRFPRAPKPPQEGTQMTAKPLIVVFPPDAGPKNSAAVKHLWTSKNEVSSHNPDTILEAIIKTACDFHLTVPLKCFINKDIPNLGTFFQITMKLFHDPYMYSTILVDALNFEWPWTLISMLDRFEAPIPEDSEQIIQVARYAIKFKDIFDGLFRRCCKRDATLRTIMLPSVIPTRNFELVKDMINLGAAVNTPRVRAAFADLITGINERNPIAEFLLQHGLDISEKTTDSRDILFVAVQKDNFEMAKL